MSHDGPKTLQEIARRSRYPLDAFFFVQNGLNYTVQKTHPNAAELTDAEKHVSGQQLSAGLRDYAVEKYGQMARTVLSRWRIHRTDDFGAIVFAMVEGGMMQATERDSVRDFADVFPFDAAFSTPIPLERFPLEGFEPDPMPQTS